MTHSLIALIAAWTPDMLFADDFYSINTVITMVVSALLAAVAALWGSNTLSQNARIADKDKQIAEKDERNKRLEMLLPPAIYAATRAARVAVLAQGKTPLEVIPDVAPNHNSVPTKKQEFEAWVETGKAQIEAAGRAVGIPEGTLFGTKPESLGPAIPSPEEEPQSIVVVKESTAEDLSKALKEKI